MFTPTGAPGVLDAYPPVAQSPPSQACLPKAWDVMRQRNWVAASRQAPGTGMIDLSIEPPV